MQMKDQDMLHLKGINLAPYMQLATALIGSVRVRGGEVERIEFRFSAPEGCARLSGADFSGGEGLGECLACYFRGLRRLTTEISSSSDSGA